MKKNPILRFVLIIISLTLSALHESNAATIPAPVNVKEFGAKGDGKTDDTEAIIAAVKRCGDGIVEFPHGSYRITRTIEIFLSQTGTIGLSGKGGSARIIMNGKGPAFRFTGTHNGTAGPESVNENTWDKERMPLIDALEIVGADPESEGLEFRHTLMPLIRGILIRKVHNGIHLVSRNRNVLIDGCHIYNCTGVGIYLDSVNLHQVIISDSHISYCKLGGIKVSRSEIRDLQITGNDIEYNCDPEGPVSADIWIDCSQRGSVREGTIAGNTIQAIPSPDGANIRFTGPEENFEQIGLWSVTGNHISNQTVNIRFDHCRGINITGNTFIRGYDRNMIFNDCHNLIISDNVIDRNKDYFPEKLICLDGILVTNSRAVILSENIIDGVEYGNQESGGAINISDSRDITLVNCHVINPKFRGIQIERSTNVRMSGCLINEDMNKQRMLWGVEITGACQGSIIKDNSVAKGKKGDILIDGKGVISEGNIIAGNQ
jgi:parallel beta-helix repeat protein